MITGALLIVAALALFLHNQQEDKQAKASVEGILPKLVQSIEDKKDSSDDEGSVLPDPYDPAMTVVEIDGYGYIGYVTLPSVGIELPVMDQWDDDRLDIAPCRYSGSVKTDDMVIAAHNFRWHFGALSSVKIGDTVLFTDMDGIVYKYTVTALDVLSATAVEDMTSGDYDLTLFTCTYGGQSRITVRCGRYTE